MAILAKNFETNPELNQLLEFLEADPTNRPLMNDIIQTAIDMGSLDVASAALKECESIGPLSDIEIGMSGLLAMKQKDFDKATSHYRLLVDDGNREQGVLFNLSWAEAMLGDHEKALETLTLENIEELPQAAMFEVQLLHQLGRFEDAEARARDLIERHPDDAGLMAAVSVLALDIEDIELAKKCARKAGDHPDALTTIGVLDLGDNKLDEARTMFEKSIAINPHRPRSWIGMGLADLAGGKAESAATHLDKGAKMFGQHLGSWIAAGWSHFIANDVETGRERFEHALDLDDTFAETHGSLAVLDVLAGDMESGKTRAKTALRLDGECFSAALAQVLIMSSEGKQDVAQKIFDRAIHTPVDETGRTLFETMVTMGLSSPDN